MRAFVLLIAVLSLAACGNRGGAGASRNYANTATGPISQACMSAGREAASRGLCGCVQSAANQSLSGADQRRAAGFFSDPQEAQDVKSSDSSSNDAFWARYRAFVSTAEAMCRG